MSADQKNECVIVVGGDKSHYSDDKSALCLDCRRTIYFRPHAPIPLEGYLCFDCATHRIKKGNIEITTTDAVVSDINDRYGTNSSKSDLLSMVNRMLGTKE